MLSELSENIMLSDKYQVKKIDFLAGPAKPKLRM